MNKISKTFVTALLSVGLIAGCATGGGDKKDQDMKAEKKDDAGLGHDYRTFMANGDIKYGQIGDSYTAELVLYLAGNQFMVMEDLIKDFQKKNPDIKSIYVETIPPGQILNGQILKQGMIEGQKNSTESRHICQC
jgi:ABC-type glycerol-3-phosphate transport system substrate-binding protein